MELTREQKVRLLWSQGYNPIRLFGDVYLVRYQPDWYSNWPIYVIKIIKGD